MRLLCSLILTTSLVTALPQQRAISLFNVVTFDNAVCQSTKSTENQGTCFSSTECGEKGGSAEGNCASGFGICCVISINKETGGDVTQNNTIVENHKYPTAYTTKSKKATYKIKLLDDICFLRFDFIKMDLAITASTGACDDKLTVTVPAAAGASPKPLCGLNDGQHMYVNNMRQKKDTTAEIATSANAHSRKWKIKIAQIECNSPILPQPGCTQYYTAACGTFESMNFRATTQLMVANFDTTICFRQNSGKCGVSIAQETDETSKDSFSLLAAKGAGADVTIAKTSAVQSNTEAATSTKSTCTNVRLQIGGLAYCGETLSAVSGSAAGGPVATKNFFIQTAQIVANNVASSKGFKLNYKQTGCS